MESSAGRAVEVSSVAMLALPPGLVEMLRHAVSAHGRWARAGQYAGGSRAGRAMQAELVPAHAAPVFLRVVFVGSRTVLVVGVSVAVHVEHLGIVLACLLRGFLVFRVGLQVGQSVRCSKSRGLLHDCRSGEGSLNGHRCLSGGAFRSLLSFPVVAPATVSVG